jgi:RHH-type transcriptional regulator, rel operon repressor / antitoxin RelB
MYSVHMASSTLTLRLDIKLKKKLDKLAKATSRSRSYLAAEAIREYVDLNSWQIEHIMQGLQEGDSGDFASVEQVQATVRKLTRGR